MFVLLLRELRGLGALKLMVEGFTFSVHFD